MCGRTVFGPGPAGVGAAAGGVAAEGFTTTVGLAALGAGAAGGFTAAGFGGAGAGSAVCLRMALSTSPGFEILERSILVLMPGASLEADDFAFEGCSSPAAKCLRTRSARSGSRELEWLFLSLMPMVGR